MNAEAAQALDQLRSQLKTQHDADMRYLWAVQMGKPTDGINASPSVVSSVQSIVAANPSMTVSRKKIV